VTGRAVLVGLIAGGLGGLLTLSWAVGLPFLGPLAIVVGCLAPPRPTGAGATLVGWGATWLALFARVASSCSTDMDCGSGTDVGPWMTVGVALIVGGVALLGAAYHRGHGRPPEPS
jgi:hypothetical protein